MLDFLVDVADVVACNWMYCQSKGFGIHSQESTRIFLFEVTTSHTEDSSMLSCLFIVYGIGYEKEMMIFLVEFRGGRIGYDDTIKNPRI